MLLAIRILTLAAEAGPIDVPVRLDAPTPGTDGGWFCAYEIAWPDEPRRFAGWGVDAVQALALTLELIGADLYGSAAHAENRLSWKAAPGGGYGFPVPRAMRDELVGEDARYL